MKQHPFIMILCMAVVLVASTTLVTSCSRSGPPEGIAHYTCPMHPQIREDAPGQCPICGMDLVAVPEATNTTTSHGDQPSSAHTIHIDPARTQAIGVTTETIQKRPLTRDILAYGKVAHDADLWVAQHEYIEALKLGDRSLMRAAERKLQFLGLSDEWITLLRKERTADLGLHLPTHTAQGYFESFLHQGDVDVVKVGQRVTVLDEKGRHLTTGSIAAIGTMVDPKTRLIRALVKADETIRFKLNTFVQFRIQIPLGEHVSVPRSAILFNGDHNMVYVAHNAGHFEARSVALGEAAGDYYAVESGVRVGDVVVTNGHFLIDSESQIKGGGTGHDHQH